MTLAEIIATRIAPATVERVAYDQGLLTEKQRNAIFKSNLSRQATAESLVAAYGDNTARLAYGLNQQVSDIDWDTSKELSKHFNASAFGSLQASLVARIPTVPLSQLREFLETIERHICLIVSRAGVDGPAEVGTGFLVAPELVLTCQHVLKSFPNGQVSQGSQIELHFDFMKGDQIDRVGVSVPEVRKVVPADPWYLESGNATDPDGVEGNLTPEDMKRIGNALDFVLLRLAEPVGLQPVSRGGGKRRGWITMPPPNVAATLAAQDWIIIPQHPDGLPQRIDLGRYVGPDQTQTRIRYSTNTAPGTSGAPCFNQNFQLVGVHNARVGPKDAPKANQAIRWDLVEPKVRPHIANAQPAAYVKRWSTSRDGEENKVIIGRGVLLDWLRASAAATPRHLADRVYVAHAEEPAAGCSFSSDILHAEIRDSKTPRAVYGERGQQLPSTAEDLLESLLREFGIDIKQVEAMPKRPGPSDATNALPLLGGEVDKLERWLSDELPSWLGRVISAHLEKQIDARDAAKQIVAAYQQLNQPPPADVVKNAEAPDPIWMRVNAWDYAYVVIDDLRSARYTGTGGRTLLKGELQSLIAALVQGKAEQAMPAGLKRLRWMFLGYVPDFITAADADGNGAIIESLNPGKVGADEIVDMFARLSDAKLPTRLFDQNWASLTAQSCVLLADAEPAPPPRLQRLQRIAGVFAGQLSKLAGA